MYPKNLSFDREESNREIEENILDEQNDSEDDFPCCLICGDASDSCDCMDETKKHLN